ncbi:MAG: hypothetical protein JSR24_00330 [Proteobacteria bacterium]|nr:hypothetical protein [Pseudomonadota bacterium]
MDHELDQHLRQLASHVKHPSLSALDGMVLDRVARERFSRQHALRNDVLSFAGALAFGVASAMTFAAPTTVSAPSALSGISPLAPSALLERTR